MANVNLISGLRAEALRFRRVTRGLCLAAAVVLASALGLLGYTTTRILGARTEIQRTETILSQLRPKIQRINDLEARRALLQPRLNTLEEAQESTIRWYGILEALKRSVSREMWLTSLSVEKGKDDAKVLRLNGVALSNRLVGETMQRLNAEITVLHDYVTLRYVQPSSVGLGEAVEFELAAQLQGAPKEANDEAQTK